MARVEIVEMPAAANISNDLDTERPLKKKTQKDAQNLYSLPERPKLRGLQANQDYEDSLQEANWRSSTSDK